MVAEPERFGLTDRDANNMAAFMATGSGSEYVGEVWGKFFKSGGIRVRKFGDDVNIDTLRSDSRTYNRLVDLALAGKLGLSPGSRRNYWNAEQGDYVSFTTDDLLTSGSYGEFKRIAGFRPKELAAAFKSLRGLLTRYKGGPGSGHHGHAGRPGRVGGSQPGKGVPLTPAGHVFLKTGKVPTSAEELGNYKYWSFGALSGEGHLIDQLHDKAAELGYKNWQEATAAGHFWLTHEGERHVFHEEAKEQILPTEAPPPTPVQPELFPTDPYVVTTEYGLEKRDAWIESLRKQELDTSEDIVRRARSSVLDINGEYTLEDGWYDNDDPSRLRNAVQWAMSGTADDDTVEMLSRTYALSQYALEEAFPRREEFRLHRGQTLDASDSRTRVMLDMIEGGLVDVGAVGHWSSERTKSDIFAVGLVDEAEDVAVIFHKTWPKESILDWYGTGITGYDDEYEFVPISEGGHRVARVDKDRQMTYDLNPDARYDYMIDVIDVYLE
jgi:hypothetical protein